MSQSIKPSMSKSSQVLSNKDKVCKAKCLIYLPIWGLLIGKSDSKNTDWRHQVFENITLISKIYSLTGATSIWKTQSSIYSSTDETMMIKDKMWNCSIIAMIKIDKLDKIVSMKINCEQKAKLCNVIFQLVELTIARP